jgi:hypothetical protein
MTYGYVAVLLTNVSLTDYDTDKKVLAPALDPCWIWPHDAAWQLCRIAIQPSKINSPYWMKSTAFAGWKATDAGPSIGKRYR